MALTKDQVEGIKQQLINHIERTFPEDKRSPAIEQIESMSETELEEFLKQNKMLQSGDGELSNQGPPPEIFRQIVEGKIPSYLIEDGKSAMAVLEINPIAPGHTIVIPKNKVTKMEDISDEILNFAETVGEKIKQKLKTKIVLIEKSVVLGEVIINVIPSDKKINLQKSERKPASKEDLEEMQKKLTKKKEVIKKAKPQKISGKIRLPNRIP